MIEKLQEVPTRQEERVWRQDELPDTDGKPVETFEEHPQSRLLDEILRPVIQAAHPDSRFIIGSNTGIYWTVAEELLDGCRAPDWFYVPGVDRRPDGERRRSYHFFRERQSPRLLVELVSGNGALERDMTPGSGKMWVYEQVLRVEYYIIYDPFRTTLEVFAFNPATNQFMPVVANQRGHFPIAVLGVEMGIWHGRFEEQMDGWLRAWDSSGVLLPNAEERTRAQTERAIMAENALGEAEQALTEAEQARIAAEQRRTTAEQARIAAEQALTEAEQARTTAEQGRIAAEQALTAERERMARLIEQLRQRGGDPDAPTDQDP